MATVPLSGTDIRLLSGVPFSNDYKNTRWFDDLNSQTNYFLSKNVVHSESQMNFQRIEGYHFIAVNKSIDQLWGTNYLMFRNAQYNNKWFYAFVTKLEYVQKNRTNVHFQIDVFQTWKFEMNFKPSFVLREHCKLWNSDGSPVINTVDEGLNYGTDYEVVSVDNYKPMGEIFFLVIVCKSKIHGTDAKKITPVLNGTPQPLSYYIHPFKLNGDTPKVSLGTISPILKVLKGLFEQDDAVNNVVSLYITDFIGYNANVSGDTLTLDSYTFSIAGVADNVSENFDTIYVQSMPSYNAIPTNLGNKYSGYKSVKESKLLMYPYTVLILDDLKGNRSILKNEYIQSNDLNITVKGSLGTSNKVSYGVPDYLMNEGMTNSTYASLEHSIINNNPNDVAVLNDYLSAFLQGNRNSLENQKDSILWNGWMNGISSAIGGVASGRMGNDIGVASAGTNIVAGAGNTVLQLQGIEAKKQDIGNTPPSLVKMGGNTAFDFGNGFKGLYIIKKQITSEYRRKLANFFNMFGYKVNEVKVPNFHTRRYWNYVQTSSCIITGNFNNDDLQELKSVFDNGITLWHTDDVGNYSLDNEVI